MRGSVVRAVKGIACAALLHTGFAGGASAAAAPTPASQPPLDFSGTWKLDTRLSVNVSPNMKGAVLTVEQRGNRMRITPGPQTAGKHYLAAEEIVVDGQPYEKAMGTGKGVLTARWSADGRALEMVLTAGPAGSPPDAVQNSSWTLSADRSTWVRETRTLSEGKARSTRLVFRRQAPEPTPPPQKSPAAR